MSFIKVNQSILDNVLIEQARAKRDQLLDDVSKRYDRYASEARLGLDTTDSIEALDIYAQALRDVTTQEEFPTSIDWPEIPA